MAQNTINTVKQLKILAAKCEIAKSIYEFAYRHYESVSDSLDNARAELVERPENTYYRERAEECETQLEAYDEVITELFGWNK